MPQALVTEFFSTRKRNRFQDEDLLAKTRGGQKVAATAAATVDEASPTKRCLRSSRHKAVEIDAVGPTSTKTVIAKEVKAAVNEGPKNEKKEAIEALKRRIKRLDEVKLKQTEVVEEPIVETKETTKKKKVTKAELKKKIEQFNENLVHIQESVKEKCDEKERQPVATVTSSQLPCHMKFKDLASESIDVSSTLTLPKSYSLLFESFKGSDTIVKLLFNRDEVCTFLKLKTGIQNITKQAFTHKSLAQIKTVYPQAYVLKYEKLFIDFKNDFHLIISPNLEEIDTNPETGLKQFTSNVLLKRLAKFKDNLFLIVKKLHQEFLASIGIKDLATENIRRWHPKFDLESLKEVEPAELPKPPNDDSIKCKTGQELLNIARDVYSSRIQEAINKSVPGSELVPKKEEAKKELSKRDDDKKHTTGETLTIQVKIDETKDSTKYTALLEKIRNKEKQKAFETMVIHSDREKKTAKYRTYSEASRFILNFFQAEKKTVLDIDKVSRKMAENLKTSVLNELECKELLNEMSSGESIFAHGGKRWLNVLKVRGQLYVQIDKAVQLNELILICDQAIKNLE